MKRSAYMAAAGKAVALIALLGVGAYFGWQYRADLARVESAIVANISPCTQPETYSLGAIDPKFGISKSDFAAAVAQAAQVWQTPIHRALFKQVPTGGAVTINLIYDYRQAATDTLRKLGITLGDDHATYDALKTRLTADEKQLEAMKASYDAAKTALQARETTYQNQVQYWNARGGAPRAEYDALNAEHAALDADVAALNAQSDAVNAKVDEVNALITVINRLAGALNLAVAQYNGVVATQGSEFEEGLFSGNRAGGTIDIYEFEDHAKLVRVLAHELGHALGLQHLNDPKAIMYRLNSGANATPTAADVAALKSLCQIK